MANRQQQIVEALSLMSREELDDFSRDMCDGLEGQELRDAITGLKRFLELAAEAKAEREAIQLIARVNDRHGRLASLTEVRHG